MAHHLVVDPPGPEPMYFAGYKMGRAEFVPEIAKAVAYATVDDANEAKSRITQGQGTRVVSRREEG